jgi:hypothetical protein
LAIISPFDVVSAFHSLEVIDLASTTFRSEHKFEVKAVSPSRFFVRQWFWTGSGSVNEAPPDLVTDYDQWGHPIQKIHGPIVVENESRIVVVDLGRIVQIGERVAVHFLHRLKDLDRTSRPFLSTVPKPRDMRQYKLRVVLPHEMATDVTFEEFDLSTNRATMVERLKPARTDSGRAIFEREYVKDKGSNCGCAIRWNKLPVDKSEKKVV